MKFVHSLVIKYVVNMFLYSIYKVTLLGFDQNYMNWNVSDWNTIYFPWEGKKFENLVPSSNNNKKSDGDAWEFPSFQIKIKMPGIAQFSDLVLLQEM